MKTLIKKIWNRIYQVNINPYSEWKVIKEEPASISWHLKKIVVPIILVIVIVNFLGYLLLSDIYNYSLLYVSVKTLSAFCESFFTFHISYLIVRELNQKFTFFSNPEKLYKLYTYSFSAFWIALLLNGLFANYKTLGNFLIFLALYGIYPLWVGAGILQNIPSKLKSRLLLFTITFAITTYLLIDWSFGFALRIIYFSGLIK